MSVKNFRERSPAVVGALSIAAIAAATTFAFYIDRIPLLKQSYDVQAEFKDGAGLTAENQVRVAGIKVGTVSDIELVEDRVVVTMEIDNGTEIPKDAFAEIKLGTLLGTKFVDLEGKGGGPLLEDGDVIPLEDTAVPYEIYQASNQGTDVLEELDGEALNDMLVELTKLTRVTQEELGVALEGLNELGTGLNAKDDELRSLLSEANDLTGLLNDEGGNVNRLIDASNQVLGSLAQKREDVQTLLEVTKQMAADVSGLIDNNRQELDSILTDLHRALIVLERNVEHLDVALRFAGPSSRYFGSLFTQGRWADIFTCALVLEGACEEGS
jgi:phospholipid/cholesterol/gamma-HCH transport system substrate-binding protein